MFTLRIDAEAIDPEAMARVEKDLAASPMLPGVDVNLLPKDQQRDLVRAELRRKQLARGRRAGAPSGR